MHLLIDESPRNAARSPVAATPSSNNQPHLVKRGPLGAPVLGPAAVGRPDGHFVLLPHRICFHIRDFFPNTVLYAMPEGTLTEQLIITVSLLVQKRVYASPQPIGDAVKMLR
jgi:hypothetical protein